MKNIFKSLFPTKGTREDCFFISTGGYCTHASEYDPEPKQVFFKPNDPRSQGEPMFYSLYPTWCKTKNKDGKCTCFKIQKASK